MSRNPVDITLAGTSYTIRPLTCRQIQAVEPILTSGGTGSWQAISIIKAGLSRDYPGVDVDDLEIPVSELNAAMTAILRQAGMSEEQPQGEAPAAALGNAA